MNNKNINSILEQSQISLNILNDIYISLGHVEEYIYFIEKIDNFIIKNKKKKIKHKIKSYKFYKNYGEIAKNHNKLNIIKRINDIYFINDKSIFNFGNNCSFLKIINKSKNSLFNIIKDDYYLSYKIK